jgi:hypothetical protein
VITCLHFDGADCLTFLVHLIVRKAITAEISGLNHWILGVEAQAEGQKEGLTRHAAGEK